MGAIVIDSSALIAALIPERDASIFTNRMEKAEHIFLSATTYTETGIVIDNRKELASKQSELDALIASFGIEIMGFDVAQAIQARAAYRRFGKGKHPAKLNMGDCFAYALAKQMDAPLLYKGSDFDKTDVKSAL